MPAYNTTPEAGLIDAIGNLIRTAEDPYCLHRQGLWFEKSGESMAVYPAPPARCVRYIARFDLRDGSYQAYLEAIDEYLLTRYLRECA